MLTRETAIEMREQAQRMEVCCLEWVKDAAVNENTTEDQFNDNVRAWTAYRELAKKLKEARI